MSLLAPQWSSRKASSTWKGLDATLVFVLRRVAQVGCLAIRVEAEHVAGLRGDAIVRGSLHGSRVRFDRRRSVSSCSVASIGSRQGRVSSRDQRQGQWDVTRRLVASRQQYTTARRRIFSPSRSLPMTYAWLIPRHGRIGRQRSKISWISTCGSCAKRRSSRVRCGSGRRRHA